MPFLLSLQGISLSLRSQHRLPVCLITWFFSDHLIQIGNIPFLSHHLGLLLFFLKTRITNILMFWQLNSVLLVFIIIPFIFKLFILRWLHVCKQSWEIMPLYLYRFVSSLGDILQNYSTDYKQATYPDTVRLQNRSVTLKMMVKPTSLLLSLPLIPGNH